MSNITLLIVDAERPSPRPAAPGSPRRGGPHLLQLPGYGDSHAGLKIHASPEDVQRAYQAKKEKIAAIDNEEERTRKMKLLQEGSWCGT